MEIRKRVHSPGDYDEKENITESIKHIDAFTKLPRECVNSTSSGGGVTILTFLAIIFLILAEISRFINPAVEFNYSVDGRRDGIIPINVDLTIAMKCSEVSLDVVDQSGRVLGRSSDVKAIDSIFALSDKRKRQFQAKRAFLSELRAKHHSIYQTFWLSHTSNLLGVNQFVEVRETSALAQQADACRFVGTFKVQKVQGNMHVAVGRAFNMNENIHVHIANLYSNGVRNFSHRIHHLSFGTPIKNYVNPLDSEEVISDDPAMMYQYFVQVVPTTFSSRRGTFETYQYAVTEQGRSISHVNNSHGVPGLFFRYDIFPVRVDVVEAGDTVIRLFIRLSAIVGGVYATVGFLCQLFTQLLPTFINIYKSLRHRPSSLSTGLGPEPLMPEEDS
ncbi:Endoplasmic reticulum-Golgi intermediate compartment protein 2 [Sparganum proliferum]